MSQITVALGKHEDVQVVTPAIFDGQHIQCGDISLNNNGGKELYLKYGDGSFLFQTPRMPCPFGVSITENPEKDGKPASKSYRLALSFRGFNDPKDRSYEKKRDFHDMMCQIDEALITKGRENSLAWIKLKPQAANEDVVRALYNPTVRVPTKDGQESNYPPTMNANILCYGGRFETEIYDQSGTLVENPEQALSKGCEVKCLIQAQKVTFPQGKFGIKYNILNMKVWPSKGGIRGRGCMIDDESDNE